MIDLLLNVIIVSNISIVPFIKGLNFGINFPWILHLVILCLNSKRNLSLDIIRMSIPCPSHKYF